MMGAARSKSPARRWSAEHVVGLLAARHAEDVWVPECKDGPTWSSAHLRLDGWAMKRSWSPWTTYGYEVKVSRSDFTGDQKWPGYLALCHEFYFVCPAGLINGADLPAGVGLIWLSANGERLHTKVRALRREPDAEKLGQLLSYVLMSRARVVAGMHEANRDPPGPRDRLDVYRELVAEAEKRQALAMFVRGHVAAQFQAQEDRLREMGERVAVAESVREHLKSLGVVWENDRFGDWKILRQVDRLAGRIPADFARKLERAATELKCAAEAVREITGVPGVNG